MYKFIYATCTNGDLILDEKLSLEMSGKKFKVILIEADEVKSKKESFFQQVDRHSFTLPDDYKFNRDELYDIV